MSFGEQPKWLIISESFLVAFVIGLLDYVTDWEWSFFVFYALPILACAWVDTKWGWAIATFCGVSWFVANLESSPYESQRAYSWAAVNRFAYFVFVAIGGTALRNLRDENRARLEAMMRARALEQEIVRVTEREQMRLGQDLHDGLCQNLAAIDCAAACLKADLEARSVPEADAVGVIQKMLSAAVVEARNLARGISPVHMDGANLPAAFEELVETTNQAGGIAATFTQHGNIQIEDAQAALHLYRIAQEALRNTVKHARATRVDIDVGQDNGCLTMTIADDGCGFSGTPLPSRGMGLGTMRYRARLIGATCEIKALSGGGTAIKCQLPLSHGRKN